MSSIDTEISSIKKRLETAQIAKVRGQAAKESAQQNYDNAMAELFEHFGVDSPEAIRAKLAELQQDLDTTIQEINTSLDELNL